MIINKLLRSSSMLLYVVCRFLKNPLSYILQVGRMSSRTCVLELLSYIAAYFDHIHPIYPFLDRQTFERKVFQGDLALLLRDSPPFSALYYSVLALGSQFHGSGSFEPGRGTSWKFFQAALGLFPEILIPKETLVNVQVCLLTLLSLSFY